MNLDSKWQQMIKFWFKYLRNSKISIFSLLELIRKKQRAVIDNNPSQLAIAHKNLGDWYHENQQYENALECYKEEASVYDSLGKRIEKAKAHRMIGEMYMLLEKFEEALNHELIYLSK